MPQLTRLVTGTSSGFGEALVSALGARGDRVHLKQENVEILHIDLDSSQAEIDEAVSKAQAAFGGIEVLVNNAGYLLGGPKWAEVYRTNVVGTVNVTRAIMPHFTEKKVGTVVFMGSYVGVVSDLGATPYNATKFALEGVLDGFHKEAAIFGVKTIIIEPGWSRTKFFDPATNIKVAITPVGAYAPVNEQMGQIIQAINGNQPGDPKKTVERITDVVKSEGLATGTELPKRLPLGADALAKVRKKCEETLKICDEWESVITSTTFDT
ncbi:NAD(P)-binding protein [Massarina eburnea CBS 473.64]|uniref:NAD(P)-binding protein n=1 Tax=Massarina eburnea CBS 473.64 TaxID=1395130 RepID=A0A6A6SGZ1_9PLEO|nr:NAD(P)-binding protein [Massarina eburnea CBS 473.64]